MSLFDSSIVFSENINSTAKIVVNQGGTWSGKTYSILQLLIAKAIESPNLYITVCGQDIPNLKSGPIRDIQRIQNSSKLLKSFIKSYNKTDRILEFTNGSIIEFNSYDDEQDAKSGKRDYLFINEANGVPYPIFQQLALRTDKQIFIDYNPSSSFWVHEIVLTNKELYPSVELLISDHRHNPFISDDMHQQIERLIHEDKETFKVYARGLTGKIEGTVIKNWSVCPKIPEDAKLIAYGVDFGFTNDPTGCLSVYKQDGELWVDELFYETGLTNPDISNKFKEHKINPNHEIIADSAEPKSIKELQDMPEKWNVIKAEKGEDSIRIGIDILNRYRINVTARSVNLRTELMKYIYKKDKLGNATNQPIDAFNHLIDPLRYVALNKLKIHNLAKPKSRLPYINREWKEPGVSLIR